MAVSLVKYSTRYAIAFKLFPKYVLFFFALNDICLLSHVQIGHITCDNARNNDTMLEEFARCYHIKTQDDFDVQRRHIRYVCALLFSYYLL
jgi:hypothetical protein